MTKREAPLTHLDILKRLNKSNCRRCGVPTCLAFAIAVISGEKKFADCPHLSREEGAELDRNIVKRGQDKELASLLEPLKKEIAKVDFRSIAQGLGAEYDGGRLHIQCLGKIFTVDRRGNVESLIHINKWVILPLLQYIIMGGNAPLTGRWVSFEELKRASAVTQYFERRCVEPLRQLAESHTDIFFDLITIFGGKDVAGFSADYARVIYPLPRVPFLILYWKPEGHFESSMKVLLDSTADVYLEVDFIIALGRGIVEMVKKILSRHEEVMPRLMGL